MLKTNKTIACIFSAIITSSITGTSTSNTALRDYDVCDNTRIEIITTEGYAEAKREYGDFKIKFKINDGKESMIYPKPGKKLPQIIPLKDRHGKQKLYVLTQEIQLPPIEQLESNRYQNLALFRLDENKIIEINSVILELKNPFGHAITDSLGQEIKPVLTAIFRNFYRFGNPQNLQVKVTSLIPKLEMTQSMLEENSPFTVETDIGDIYTFEMPESLIPTDNPNIRIDDGNLIITPKSLSYTPFQERLDPDLLDLKDMIAHYFIRINSLRSNIFCKTNPRSRFEALQQEYIDSKTEELHEKVIKSLPLDNYETAKSCIKVLKQNIKEKIQNIGYIDSYYNRTQKVEFYEDGVDILEEKIRRMIDNVCAKFASQSDATDQSKSATKSDI